jgi:hypothetical protein
MDALVLENILLLKNEQASSSASDIETYQKSFALD